MATGSGKTKVMALAVAWQYFNAVAEARDDYAKTFLRHRPQRHRLRAAAHRLRRRPHLPRDPIIPDELRIFWDFQCYMRGEGERAGSPGRST